MQGTGESSRAGNPQTQVFGSHGISPLSFFLDQSPAFYTEPFTTALANLTQGDELQ